MKTASAFAPANISLLFIVVDNKDPQKMGSKGLGFTIEQGVTVTVSKSKKTEILWNNAHIKLSTLNYVLKQLTQQTLKVCIESVLPLGCGFGLSGASALATAYAINQLYNLKKSNLELAHIAHSAEVINKTGLGDVVNQYFGGVCLKTEVSSHFKVRQLGFEGMKLYFQVYSELSTKSILTNSDLVNRINQIGKKKLDEIQLVINKNDFTLHELLDICYSFCLETGFIQKSDVKEALNKIRSKDVSATMILIGNAIVSTKPFFGCKQLTISNRSAQVII